MSDPANSAYNLPMVLVQAVVYASHNLKSVYIRHNDSGNLYFTEYPFTNAPYIEVMPNGNTALHSAQQTPPNAQTATMMAIAQEFRRAVELHPKPFNSGHEALAVINEQVEEFKREVFKRGEARSKPAMREELIQIAAMCVRTIIDLELTDEQ